MHLTWDLLRYPFPSYMMRQQLCSSCLYHPSKSLPSLSLYLVHVVCIYPHACHSFLHLSPFFWVQFSFARSKSYPVQFSSVQLSHSVVSDSLWPHEPQHARPPCPSPTPGVYPNSHPLNWWCHPTLSASVVPFSSALNLSQHQGLFKWVSSSHQLAKEIYINVFNQFCW